MMKKHMALLCLLVSFAALVPACDGKTGQQHQELKILTQNVQLFPTADQLVPASKDDQSTLTPHIEKLSPLQKERIPLIEELIKSYDIVCFQEAWNKNALEKFVSAWKAELEKAFQRNLDKEFQKKTPKPIQYSEYYVIGPHVPAKFDISLLKEFLKLAMNIELDSNEVDKTSGGLVILTKYPILKAGGHVFTEAAALDAVSTKGVIYARIQVGKTKEDYIHVFNTHLQAQNCDECKAARAKQLEELRKFIAEQTKDDKQGHPIMVLGDFNIHGKVKPEKGDEYSRELDAKLLKPRSSDPTGEYPPQLVDIWKEKYPTQPGYTWMGKDKVDEKSGWGKNKNVLAVEEGDPERLDYILYFEGVGKWALTPAGKSPVSLVPLDSKKEYKLDKTTSHTLSDHLGLQTIVNFVFPKNSEQAAAEKVRPTQTEAVRVEEQVPATFPPPTGTPTSPPPMTPPFPATFFVGFNTAESPFDLVQNRQAFSAAIDREALLDAIGPEGRRQATTFVPPEIWPDGRYLYLEIGRLDPGAVWADSIDQPIILAAPDNAIDIARIIQSNWRERLGIEVKLEILRSEGYLEQLETIRPQLFLLGWIADYPTMDNFIYPLAVSKLVQWSNSEFDQLVEAARREQDLERSLELNTQAEKILCIDQAAIAPLYYYSYPDENLRLAALNLERGKEMLIAHDETGEGDCTESIRRLQAAIADASAVLELDPGNPKACLTRGLSRRWLEEDLDRAIEDLECAVTGLEGQDKVEAEKALAEVREMVSMPVCAILGPPVFAEQWDWDQPIEPSTSFPLENTQEVWAHWSISNSCNETVVVKWYHDKELVCQHHIDFQEDWTWGGSGWVADEEWIEAGIWCVEVRVADGIMTEGCFTVE